jgi:hydrogenase-4 component F
MNQVLIISGILSLLVSAGYMLKAKHIKRMLAYSSLENMGLAAIALGIGGKGYYAALFLIVLHSFAKSSLFYHMGQLSRVLHTFKLDDSGKYMKLYPAGGFVMIIGMLCILAIPPSGLFISEFLIFKAMVYNSQWFVFVLTAIFLSVVIYALGTRVMHLVFSDPRKLPDDPGNHLKVQPVESLSQFILLTLVIIMCFYQPPVLIDLISQSIAGLP